MTRDDQIDQLILHEGTGPVKRGRLMPYTDTTGHLTVGYGRNLDANGLRVSEARLMLSNDLTDATDECRAKFLWFDTLDPVRQAVVVELLFNMGYPTLAKFTNTLAAIERHDWIAAGEGLKKSKWYQQVRQTRGHRLVTQLVGGFWALVLAVVLSGCASDGGPLIWNAPPIIIAHRKVPEGWTLPEKYSHCTVVQHNGQKIIENGKRQGRSVIKLDCPESMVYVDTISKRRVWEHKW